MTPEQAREKATANFKSGMNCSQSVAATFAEEFGYSPEEIVALVQPFGGGMSRMREVCGTVSGMLFCLGMFNSKKAKSGLKINGLGGDKSQKDETYAIGQKLAEEFRKINGSIVCRELLGLVPMGTSEKLMKAGKADSHEASAPVSEARTEEYYKKRPCAELCGIAAEIFQKYLDGTL
jgi:C_GCAxxG_C_C family probable redox protein